MASGLTSATDCYGLTLGLTWQSWCRKEGKYCPWLDLTVNPSDDVRALGIGLAYSWRNFRLGAGALWTKHPELGGGQSFGDLLEAADDLTKQETYGDPDFYVGISVTGWPPFVPE